MLLINNKAVLVSETFIVPENETVEANVQLNVYAQLRFFLSFLSAEDAPEQQVAYRTSGNKHYLDFINWNGPLDATLPAPRRVGEALGDPIQFQVYHKNVCGMHFVLFQVTYC